MKKRNTLSFDIQVMKGIRMKVVTIDGALLTKGLFIIQLGVAAFIVMAGISLL